MSTSISPLYTIHQYREDMFKVVAFKRVQDSDALCLREPSEYNHYDNKLDSNFSRARSMVLQYALCNPWDWFFTGTLDSRKMNRFDLDTFAGRLSQWIRDMRKAYNAKFQVLLVPEIHKDGAWHMHGLIYGLPLSVLIPFYCAQKQGMYVPQKLVEGGFFDWPDYRKKFGFCSLAPIREPIATAYYISKYVSKDLSRRASELGKHLYFHSRPLKKADRVSDVYYFNPKLDSCCTQEYDFCKVGMVENADWTFPYIWDGVDFPADDLIPPSLPDPLEHFHPETILPPVEVWEQLRLSLAE